jgi:hypothetical protein
MPSNSKILRRQSPYIVAIGGKVVQFPAEMSEDEVHDAALSIQMASDKGENKDRGAPADFGGAVFSNEGDIVPQDDDAPPAIRPTRMSGGAKLDKSLGTKSSMDISNPAKAQIVPDPMVPREQ